MAEPLEQLKSVLKKHGQSLTKPRRAVFAALQDKEPQSMNEVIASCHGQVDRASVYRTVAVFEQLGIIQRLQIGWKYKLELSDTFQHHHHHLTCRRCGVSIALEEDSHLEAMLQDAAARHGFLMEEHQLEIQGLCANCKKAYA